MLLLMLCKNFIKEIRNDINAASLSVDLLQKARFAVTTPVRESSSELKNSKSFFKFFTIFCEN